MTITHLFTTFRNDICDQQNILSQPPFQLPIVIMCKRNERNRSDQISKENDDSNNNNREMREKSVMEQTKKDL